MLVVISVVHRLICCFFAIISTLLGGLTRLAAGEVSQLNTLA